MDMEVYHRTCGDAPKRVCKACGIGVALAWAVLPRQESRSIAFSTTTRGRVLRSPLSRTLATCRSVEVLDRVKGIAIGVAAPCWTAVAAVAIAGVRKSRSALSRAAFEDEIGVQAPLGFWDPIGFTDDGDMEAYYRRRSVEFKHGRIAMLATMGYITPELIGKWPGFLSPSMNIKFVDIPNGLNAFKAVPMLGWTQILIYFGFVEFTGGFDDYRNRTPGEYGWTVLTAADPAERKRKLNADLANGRLAMVAIIAMLFQDGLTGSAWGAWASDNSYSVAATVLK